MFVAIGGGMLAGIILTQTLALFVSSGSWRHWSGPGPAAGWLVAVVLSGAAAGALAVGSRGRVRTARAAAVGGCAHIAAALGLVLVGALVTISDPVANALLLLAGAVGTAMLLLEFPLRPLLWMIPVYLLLSIEALPPAIDFWAVCLWATLAGIARRRGLSMRGT